MAENKSKWQPLGTAFVVLLAVVAVVSFGLVAHQSKTDGGSGGPAPSVAPVDLSVRTAVSSLWIGDSYTHGDFGLGPNDSASCQVAEALHWACHLDAQGGTGFINDGHVNTHAFSPLPTRLASTRKSYGADVVIVDAGRNDPNSTKTRATMVSYLRQVRADWPKAKIVVIIPFFMRSTTPSPFTGVLTKQAKAIGAIVEDPFKNGWIKPVLVRGLVAADGVHPNPAGYVYLTAHFLKDFKALGLDKVAVTTDTATAS